MCFLCFPIRIMEELIKIEGARENNLQNISINIPRNKLVVITGLSGSGKSSLAFDTIYAEGQRRYIETFSAYARQFLGGMERPDVDKIEGLSPVISIEQKTVSRNPRSTVGTITEIYDFMRLLFARASTAYSYETGEKMVRYSDKQIVELILEKYADQKLVFLAPVVRGRKGHYRELFEQIAKQGFVKVRTDGEVRDIVPSMRLDRYKIHDIEVVVDRLKITPENKPRISQAITKSMQHGKGTLMVMEHETNETKHFSRFLMCPTSGISYTEPEPNLFSFNSPYGACKKCNGLGEVAEIDIKKIIPNRDKTLRSGAIAPLGEYKSNWIYNQIEAILTKHNHKLTDKVSDLDEQLVNTLLYGSDELIDMGENVGVSSYSVKFEGVISFIERQAEESTSKPLLRWAHSFMNKVRCDECDGTRIKKEAHYFKIGGKNIADLASMDIIELSDWFKTADKHFEKKELIIAREPLKEIGNRIQFLVDVGLTYLTLNRSAKTLSGGEAQRIRLATQIGSELVNVLYILDEPSIGLHQRDNFRLIDSLKKLRDIGNSVIVVEHDKDMMIASDQVIDIGPGAGIHGGKVVAQGRHDELEDQGSTTALYLNGKKEIATPKKRRKGNGKKLTLNNASGNNLKNVSVKFPLGKFICVTGVSGSGKSTLINGTLYPLLNAHIFKGVKKPLAYKSVKGLEHLDKVIEIDQSPIGRTPRSNPATYTGIFSEIRNIFSVIPEAKIRGYKPGRFSFNVSGGRCETCKGAGLKLIEMNFLPDVHVECEDCQGKRYNRETLEIRYKGKTISDVLNLTVEQAIKFWEGHPKILKTVKTLYDVGLGYITLGQQSTTLSGGEAQRVKLSTELSKKGTGQTFYILDEPTTGLHFEDVKMLLDVLNRLTDEGNTVLVIEHNMDVIKVADHIIDLGPEGGSGGGTIIAEGTPEQIVKVKESYTGAFLLDEL